MWLYKKMIMKFEKNNGKFRFFEKPVSYFEETACVSAWAPHKFSGILM